MHCWIGVPCGRASDLFEPCGVRNPVGARHPNGRAMCYGYWYILTVTLVGVINRHLTHAIEPVSEAPSRLRWWRDDADTPRHA